MKKVWLITGSSRGLGKALAQAVVAKGDLLVATARNTGDLHFLQTTHPDNVLAMRLDVTDERNAHMVVEAAIEKFKRIDVLVNNAGYGNINSIEETSLSDFRAQVETNLFGTVILTKAVLPHMRKQRSGHIIQFSSVGGRIGPIGRGAYAAAKWAVEGFSEVLSREVSPLGIKVTIVEPGGFRTDFAGTSSNIQAGLPEYDATVGATARFQLEYNGKQPGDPAKAAQAILNIAQLEKPPLRLLLGSDAVKAVEQNDLQKIAADREWRDISLSTDY